MPRTKLKPPPLSLTEDAGKKHVAEGDSNDFVAKTYSRFLTMYTAWNMRLPILGGRKPLEFWNDSVRDYAVLAAEFDDPNDPVEAYQSTISRDKTNTLYANLASKFFYPSCVAQNNEQSIDRTLGKVGDAVLYWSYKQDGWPSESGQQKNSRLVHKCAVEGTAYTLDIVDEDGLNSQMIPNEEIFYPNLWQPNVQLQSRVYRVRLNMSVGEAEEEWGDNDNWDKVDTSGGWTSAFIIQYPELKGIFDGIVQSDKVSVIYTWERATQKQLKELKAKKKVSGSAKRAWYYNVIVNNVPMFPLETVSPYKSGFLPISKMIFEPMAKAEFALGNSVPNKCAEDKRWKDAWKTNLRWRGKLAGMPPQLVIGGHLNGEEVMLPAVFTSLPKDVEVKQVPGIMPITATDMDLMNMADQEIDRSTIEPAPTGKMAARTAMLQQANAQLMLEPFSQQLAFFAASRSFHILMASLQYLPKGKLAKLAVPDQALDDGLTGTFEVIFKEVDDVLASEVSNDDVKNQMDQMTQNRVKADPKDVRRLLHSFKIKADQAHSRSHGSPIDRIYVSPSYIEDLRFYLFADAEDGMKDKDAMAQAKFAQDLPLMLQDQTGSLVPKEVWREYIRMRGYNDRLLQKGSTPQMGPGVPPGAPPNAQGPNLPPGPQQTPPSSPNQLVNAASAATGGGKMPQLAGV